MVVSEIKDDGAETSPFDKVARETAMRGRAELLGGWLQLVALPGGGNSVRCGIPVHGQSTHIANGTDR
jgi:hypothetical protein